MDRSSKTELTNMCLIYDEKRVLVQEKQGYIVILYKTDRFEGELKSSEEGRVFWLDRSEIESADLIWNMRELMQIFETGDFSEFFFKIQNGSYKGELLG